MKKIRLEDFAYDLPKNLIAQQPMKPRDHSRLLVLDRISGKIKHRHFYDMADYFKKGDVLVLNNTKVMPARLIGRKAVTGGKVEVFLLKKIPPLNLPLIKGENSRGEIWQCLVGGKKRKENLRVEFAGGLKAEILKNNQDGAWSVEFNKRGSAFMKLVKKIGQAPLPPYVKRQDSIGRYRSLQNDRNCYQTVYADETKIGSVAAPTAGFHFTPALLKKLKNQGVQIEYVTLRVGLGTFAPVKVDDITKHKMHAEWIEVDKHTLKRIVLAKLEGRRIIAVGTTSARTLESVFKNRSNYCHCEDPPAGGDEACLPASNLAYSALDQRLLRRPAPVLKNWGWASRNDRNYSAWTDIFIYPGYKFKAVDAMITNFHLPKSTLLMLASAFAEAPADIPSCAPSFAKAWADKSALAGRNKIFKAYREAIKRKYRFYSYGDAMLIF